MIQLSIALKTMLCLYTTKSSLASTVTLDLLLTVADSLTAICIISLCQLCSNNLKKMPYWDMFVHRVLIWVWVCLRYKHVTLWLNVSHMSIWGTSNTLNPIWLTWLILLYNVRIKPVKSVVWVQLEAVHEQQKWSKLIPTYRTWDEPLFFTICC